MSFWIYDLIVVAVLALFTWLGWRRGLLLSLCGLAVVAVAFVGAGFLADTLDDPIAKAAEPKLEEIIAENLSDRFTSADPSANPIADLREMGGLYTWVADTLTETRESMDSVALDTVQGVAHKAAQTIAVQAAHCVIFAVAFILLFVLLTLLLHALDLVAKLPGLHFCNGLGGGVIGLVKGGIMVFVAVGVASMLLRSYMPDTQTLERTYLFKFFVKNNPLVLFFGG